MADLEFTELALEMALTFAGDHVIHSKVEYDFHIEQIELCLLKNQTDSGYSDWFWSSACEAYEIKKDLPSKIMELYLKYSR
ncbi:hypothetical protein [Pseudoalteromonas sp. MEBiC 03485]|uniref:hypothetical protein n=1 Tax=Pseudoalteromonas sp. MEBiC 03485 TaxID=2571103 RepID=UPI0010200BC2|nr:hypothetical protein [Pseudoalteromonas sp. MEBiC 03485]RZD20094.1 hypothetical protein EVU92_18480 [Pseudoalteromonas sp. MEBiC 03485]